MSLFASMPPSMPSRRLEDRIRELCARALFEKDSQWSETICELQSAIREHELRVTNLAAAATAAHKPHLVRERRVP